MFIKVISRIVGTVLGVAVFATSLSHAQTITTAATYQNGVVSIPIVDSAELVGFVQDAKLQQTTQGDWRMVEYKGVGQALNAGQLNLALLESVELVVTDSFPTQVFLKMKGGAFGCYQADEAPQRRIGNTFEVAMYELGPRYPEVTDCVSGLHPFTKVVPLAVYGLSAGTYQYQLKAHAFSDTSDARIPKTFTGSFVLSKDNSL